MAVTTRHEQVLAGSTRCAQRGSSQTGTRWVRRRCVRSTTTSRASRRCSLRLAEVRAVRRRRVGAGGLTPPPACVGRHRDCGWACLRPERRGPRARPPERARDECATASSRCRSIVISAFHSAHPRARAHIAESASTAARKASRERPSKTVQAITRSQEGSPQPEVPKSMTALRTPALTRRFPGATSPWNQTSGPSQTDVSAASHTSVAAVTSTSPASTSSA